MDFKDLIPQITGAKKQALFILGCGLCAWIFYIRVILIRLPKDLTFSCKYCLLLYLVALTSFSYLLVKELYRFRPVKKPEYPPITNKVLIFVKEKILEPVTTSYSISLALVHRFFIDKHGGIIKEVLHYSSFKIYALVEKPFWNNVTLHRWLYILILIFPRIVVLTITIIDTVLFHRLDHVYKWMWLLLIPLFWKIYFYCLEKHLALHKLFTGIFFEINIIQDPEEAEVKCPGQTPPIYEFIPRLVPEKTLARFSFVKDQKDRDKIAQNFMQFDSVESGFISILSEKGPIPLYSREYNKMAILMHFLSVLLWSYMFVKTVVMLWL